MGSQVILHGTRYSTESTEAMWIKSLVQESVVLTP